jgi:immune inhibitor A
MTKKIGHRRVLVHRSDTCFVPPSPELRAKWNRDLDQARKGVSAGGAHLLSFARKPRRLGFDDGVIIPPEEFPFGTAVDVIRSAAADRAPLRGTVRVVVILVDFSDKAMTATGSHFHDLFFSSGVLPHGSVKEYYTEVTNGLVTLDGDVLGPYRMPQTLAWYANGNYGIGKGPGDFRSPQLAYDAAVAADPHVNFAPYDNDGNGFVDAFIVVHAGPGAEVTGNSGDIWSHKSTLATAYNADTTKIYGYLTIPEDARIGVCAHELGHLLFGFPDLYDTDYSSEGIGNWCLMSGGSWNGGGDVPAHASAWCKANQGWVSVTNITTNGSATIPDVKTSHNVLRLWKGGASGPEYFLLENRQRTAFDANLPGDGLLLWHIDENQPGNTDETHYEVGLLQSDGKRDLELNHNRGDAGDPYPGSSNVGSVTANTTPNTKSYANQDTCVAITSISTSGPTMTATINVNCGKSVAKDVKDHHKEGPKEIKEGPKEIKDHAKEGKEYPKDIKEVAKDNKDHKDHIKEHKDTPKDVKDGPKDLKDRKEHKEGFKEHKEIFKEHKEFPKEIKDVFEWPHGGLGGGGDPSAQATAGGVLESLEARVAALEAAVGAGVGGAGGAAQPFIGSELRPDLIGAPSQGGAGNLGARMAAGDASAKREFDTKVR